MLWRAVPGPQPSEEILFSLRESVTGALRSDEG